MNETFYCPTNCEYLQRDKKSFCKLGYENMEDATNETVFDQSSIFLRPERCVQDELAERETWDREDS
jgi:hypothetical protein